MYMSYKQVLLLSGLLAHVCSISCAVDKSQFDFSQFAYKQQTKDRLGRRNRIFNSAHSKDEANVPSRSRDMDNVSRRSKLQSNDLALANAHFLLIRSNYSCQIPRPRLVYMKDLFYSLDKVYMPRCTVLYKCDDESGCCSHEGHSCVPKRQQAIQAFFFVTTRNMTNSVETVTLTNHTECECRPVNHYPRSYSKSSGYEDLVKDILGSDSPEVAAVVTVTNASLFQSGPEAWPVAIEPTVSTTTTTTMIPLRLTQSLPPAMDTSLQVIDDTKLQEKKRKEDLCNRMKCPAPFQSRRVSTFSSKCQCDCLNATDSHCLRIKRGLQRLNGSGTSCVRRGLCQVPACESGAGFDKMKGICRQKKRHDNNDEDYFQVGLQRDDKKLLSVHERD